MNITNYDTLIFDCDGVILNSNKAKTEAFYKASLPYGEKAAQRLVNYHTDNGGISRYRKFEWFLKEVAQGKEGPSLEQLLEHYASEVRNSLSTCGVAEGLFELRQKTPNSKWLIVSGGDQKELREIFRERNLESLFNGGIFGSPDSKDEILKREIEIGNIKGTAIFLGDSRYDHIAAITAKVDFIFLTAWSEFSSWSEYCSMHKIQFAKSIQSLIP